MAARRSSAEQEISKRKKPQKKSQAKEVSNARAAQEDSPGESALYLYGITQDLRGEKQPANARRPLRLDEGIDGTAPVEAVPCVGLVCWASRVSRYEFVEELAGNMENLDWLATAGVRHQNVVSDLAGLGTVLPARFGTVFLTLDSLQKDVARRKPELLKSFKKVAGADEWGIKVFMLSQPSPPIEAESGADYLRQKSAALKSQTRKRGQFRDLNPEVKLFSAELQKLAIDSTSGGRVSSGQTGLEWQTSILLPRKKQKSFQSLVDGYARQWQGKRRIECTGPWPPYSFVNNG